jgi:hypothetical protein
MKRTIALFAASALVTAAAPAVAATANFDGITASPTFAGTTPGGTAGPAVTDGGINFSGGVILNGSAYGNEETTSPNLYATSNYLALTDGSLLPGAIAGDLGGITNSITLDVMNGAAASVFTLSLFDGATLVGTDPISLGAFGSSGAVGNLSYSGAGFDNFKVTSGQGAGSIDFGIDTVTILTVSAVPEPATWVLMFVGFAGVGGALRRQRSKGALATG